MVRVGRPIGTAPIRRMHRRSPAIRGGNVNLHVPLRPHRMPETPGQLRDKVRTNVSDSSREP